MCYPDSYITITEWLWATSAVEELFKKQGEIERWMIQHPETIPCALYLDDQPTYNDTPHLPTRQSVDQRTSGTSTSAEVICQSNRSTVSRWKWSIRIGESHSITRKPVNGSCLGQSGYGKIIFGNGLVSNAKDFGVRSGQPTHPELLTTGSTSQFISQDGALVNFIDRSLLSAILPTIEPCFGCGPARSAKEVDAENRLLWKMNARRLSFEEMRDSLLSFSNELSFKAEEIARDLFSGEAEGQFRRSVFAPLIGTYLPPF